MTTLGLPMSVLRFFEPRPAAQYMTPLTKPGWDRKKIKIGGVAQVGQVDARASPLTSRGASIPVQGERTGQR